MGERRRAEVFGTRRAAEVLVPWPATPTAAQTSRNLIVIYLDDPPWFRAFQDVMWDFPEGPYIFAQTPNIDALAARGLRFRYFANASVCSPGRASLLTGVFPREHGLGTVSRQELSGALGEFGDPGFVRPTWPPAVRDVGVDTAVIGKLHLSMWETETNTATGLPGIGWQVLERLGFQYAFTTLRNLNQPPTAPTQTANTKAQTLFSGGYYRFNLLTPENAALGDWSAVEYQVDENGDDSPYATEYFFGAAAKWIGLRGANPWVLYLPHPFAHSPYDGPPQEMVTTEAFTEASEELGPTSVFKRVQAMTEAFDHLLGWFLDMVGEEVLAETTIMLIGDNGLDGPFITSANELGINMGPDWAALHAANSVNGEGRYKGSQYRMGTYGQLLVAGPDVANPGGFTDAITCIPDVAATIADILNAPFVSQGKSFWPVVRGEATAETHERQAGVSEVFSPNGNHLAITHRAAWDVSVTYNGGEECAHVGTYWQLSAGPTATGVEPGSTHADAARWLSIARYHSRCEARLSGLQTASAVAVSGVFSLVRRRSNDVDLNIDQLYRLADLSGNHVDKLELVELDKVEYAAHYAAMVAAMENEFAVPSPSNLALEIRDADGVVGYLPVDESTGNLRLRDSSGVPRELLVSGGKVSYRRFDGSVWDLDLVPYTPGGTAWWLPIRREDGALSGIAAELEGTRIPLRRSDGTMSYIETPGRELVVRRSDGSFSTLPLTDTLPSGGGGGPPPVDMFLPLRASDGTVYKIAKNLSGHIPFRRSDGSLSQLLVTSDTITVRAASGATFPLPLVP